MSARGQADVVVVGAGVVGAACALALAQLGLEVVLVEASAPSRWQAARRDLRVYAFAPDNAALLDSLHAWQSVLAARAQPYRRMRVWDAAGGGELAFDADAFGRRELGWIVEHALLVDRLWDRLAGAGVRVLCPARVDALAQDAQGVRLQLDDGTRVAARLAVAADGAESSLRALAGVDAPRHDYDQRGIVAYVSTAHPHEDTAWQRFLPGGPLAFLPCGDGLSSIVWSAPDAEATRLLALDDAAFVAELAHAFDARLGDVALASPRAAFPLRRQLAQECVAGHVLLVGDAAHVVHPLAGQGVNLGLRDVAALRDSVAAALRLRTDWSAPHRLARWGRTRHSENALAAYAFEGMLRVFAHDAPMATLLRGPLLGLAGRMPPLAHLLWRRASGA
ncbi:MAG: FAD-dependent oxidoreductase [Lysobacter sp.]|nr:FAD-dependent oxidoreductase [Lysobacter sp.]